MNESKRYKFTIVNVERRSVVEMAKAPNANAGLERAVESEYFGNGGGSHPLETI